MLAAMRAALLPIPDHVPDFEALPPELRQQIPPIRIQGHRWHADPSQRFVQIDGRRVSEDGVAGQELWLRQIRKDAVVMQFRDSLYVLLL
ncbi:MAG: general secretion pathway protein GspB [Pseudomarimonas sp.]